MPSGCEIRFIEGLIDRVNAFTPPGSAPFPLPHHWYLYLLAVKLLVQAQGLAEGTPWSCSGVFWQVKHLTQGITEQMLLSVALLE